MNEMREVERRKLNIVEGLILSAIIALVGATLYQAKQMVLVQTTVEFTRDDIKGLREQLANVPALEQRMSRAEVKVEALEEQQKELRAMRGLK